MSYQLAQLQLCSTTFFADQFVQSATVDSNAPFHSLCLLQQPVHNHQISQALWHKYP